jgi:cytochrome c oxidase subunit 2
MKVTVSGNSSRLESVLGLFFTIALLQMVFALGKVELLVSSQAYKCSSNITFIGGQWLWFVENTAKSSSSEIDSMSDMGYIPICSSADEIDYKQIFSVGNDIENFAGVAAQTTVDLNCNTVYRLLLSSKDVIHSFAMPSLGVKADCFPGRCTTTTIKSVIKGIYFGNCSELCGPAHYNMSFQIYFK